MDYSAWRGTHADFTRERFIMDDMEREIEVAGLDRVMRTRTMEAFEIARKVNDMVAPWLGDGQNDKSIMDELDELLEEEDK